MASELELRIQQEARKLLEAGDVALVIGYAAGSAPFKATPVFISKQEDVDKLVWNPACTNNLAVYLPKYAKLQNVAVVAKPCDVKSIITLLQESQIKRENVRVIGLTCAGVVEADTLASAGVDLANVTSVDWDGSKISVSGTAYEAAKVVKGACKFCNQRTPVVSDVTVGDEIAPEGVLEYQDELPETVEGRRAYWAKQFDKCVRCYACRQVCPSCYCHTCFADRGDLKWTSKRAQGEEAWMFHVTRAMHLAGRCIACGECSRVCPMGIPVGKLTKELEKQVKELWDFEAGMDIEAAPALGSFTTEDADPLGH